MQKNMILTGLVMLLLGGFIGFAIGRTKVGMYSDKKVPTDMHMMEDGSMMANEKSMSMLDMMKQMNTYLLGITGDKFDKTFLAEMIVHHQGAVDMAQLALTSAKHQEIKDLAKEIIEAQNKEIEQMKVWQRKWYPVD